MAFAEVWLNKLDVDASVKGVSQMMDASTSAISLGESWMWLSALW
jgi:hypothetical protein